MRRGYSASNPAELWLRPVTLLNLNTFPPKKERRLPKHFAIPSFGYLDSCPWAAQFVPPFSSLSSTQVGWRQGEQTSRQGLFCLALMEWRVWALNTGAPLPKGPHRHEPIHWKGQIDSRPPQPRNDAKARWGKGRTVGWVGWLVLFASVCVCVWCFVLRRRLEAFTALECDTESGSD